MHSFPFMLDIGQNPQLGMEPLRELCLETLNNFTSRMEAGGRTCSALAKAADDMAQFYDVHHREVPLFVD